MVRSAAPAPPRGSASTDVECLSICGSPTTRPPLKPRDIDDLRHLFSHLQAVLKGRNDALACTATLREELPRRPKNASKCQPAHLPGRRSATPKATAPAPFDATAGDMQGLAMLQPASHRPQARAGKIMIGRPFGRAVMSKSGPQNADKGPWSWVHSFGSWQRDTLSPRAASPFFSRMCTIR